MAEVGLPSTFTSGGLASMVASTHACRFEVAEFFVSWQGVLTVAYTGFSDDLLEVHTKLSLQDSCNRIYTHVFYSSIQNMSKVSKVYTSGLKIIKLTSFIWRSFQSI